LLLRGDEVRVFFGFDVSRFAASAVCHTALALYFFSLLYFDFFSVRSIILVAVVSVIIISLFSGEVSAPRIHLCVVFAPPMLFANMGLNWPVAFVLFYRRFFYCIPPTILTDCFIQFVIVSWAVGIEKIGFVIPLSLNPIAGAANISVIRNTDFIQNIFHFYVLFILPLCPLN